MRTLLTSISLLLTFSLFAQDPIVKTDKGSIQGYTENNTNIFKGIPFAKPPVGVLRWKAPQPMDAWKGVKECKAFGASPMQAPPVPFFCWSEEYLIPKEPIGEDCLYLNVWSSLKKTKEKKAVLVYIYGGGFRSGGTGCAIYDGTNMAQKDIVFVSINYRVGVFGFLAHRELSQEAPYKASGNYALLDMISALKWVKANIAKFGGDPDRVTIAGQSAGAFAVNFLCASPLAKGLFHCAIAESGGAVMPSTLRGAPTVEDAYKMGDEFAAQLGAKNLADLRALSAEKIQSAQGGMSFPLVEGYVLPVSVHDIYAAGKQNDVPLILGWNFDDNVGGQPKKATEYQEEVRSRFGALAGKVLEAYPGNTDEEAAASQRAMGRDETFGIQDYNWGKLQVSKGRSKVFLYNFNRKIPFTDPAMDFGAFHTGEVPYAYDNLYTVNKRPFTDGDRQLSTRMSDYWANFAKTGDPNGPSVPQWPAYDNNTEMVQLLDLQVESKPLPTKKQLTVLEEYHRSASPAQK
jgi:para-nitrobenzyl esterase